MKISKQQRDLILGMTLGDGHISNKTFFVLHCEAQKSYVEWKHKLLSQNGIFVNSIKEKNNNGFKAYYFKTRPYDFISRLRTSLYSPKKRITRKILNRLTPLTIAIWYMDDGGLSQKKQNGKVHANDLMLNTGLQKEENQIIIDYFKEVWGIQFTQVKNHNIYRLRCGTKEARKFISLVKPYVQDVGCFDYKIAIKD